MGWAGGSSLMSTIINDINEKTLVAGFTDVQKQYVYMAIIDAFQGADCDTLDECMGVDSSFDAAYRAWLAGEHGDDFDDEHDDDLDDDDDDLDDGWEDDDDDDDEEDDDLDDDPALDD